MEGGKVMAIAMKPYGKVARHKKSAYLADIFVRPFRILLQSQNAILDLEQWEIPRDLGQPDRHNWPRTRKSADQEY